MARKPKPTEPKMTAIRLKPEDQEIAAELRAKLGLDFTSLVRLALRRLREEYRKRNDFAAD